LFSDNLGDNVQVGLLRDSTEIIVKPNVINSVNFTYVKNTDANDKLGDNVVTDEINQNVPITKYNNRFVFRTVLVEKTLLESDYIYDYCALISKAHMSLLNKNTERVSDHSFVKISLLHKLDKTKDSKNKSKVDDTSVIINLCPLDKFMNNIEKMESITWPTIYVTKTIYMMLDLSMNSKVILELMNQKDNNICDVQNIYISPIKEPVSYY